jgi:hypothetical protein
MDDENKKIMHQFELSRLKNSTDNVIKDRTLSQGFAPIKNATDNINTKQVVQQIGGNDFVEKIAKLRALKQAGKKMMGIIPFAGAGYAALQGDPAMASEELAGDIPVVGQAYEAIKPTESGNPEEERQMIAERNAQVNYNNSPARLARLKALQGMAR